MDLSQYSEPITFGSSDAVSANMLNIFKNLTVSASSEFIQSENLTADIIERGLDDLAEYRSKYIVAAEFHEVKLIRISLTNEYFNISTFFADFHQLLKL